MNARMILSVAALTVAVQSMDAQVQERRAVLRGGGYSDRGKCTIEVVVDGAADVEVRSDRAFLRNLSGNLPQWRRFECSAIMPPNPANLRFEGVDGRGRQQLINDPGNGGPIVVRIEDPDNGAEGYTFDLTWSGSGPAGYGYRGGGVVNRGDGYRDEDVFHRDRDEWYRRDNWRPRFFERIRDDVEHLRSSAFSRGDQYRLARTLQELNELQGKLARGRYDERELDDVIGALQRVVQDNRLTGRDRSILADDLDRMRDFRARHDDYGAR